MVAELEKIPWATFHPRGCRGKEALRLTPASALTHRPRVLLNRVLWGRCEDADVDTKSAPVCGDPRSQCSLWKFKPDRNILWMLDNCSRSPLTDNICHYRQGLNSVSALAVWWPAFESNLLPDADLLNFFLFCWRHFLVCKMHSRS